MKTKLVWLFALIWILLTWFFFSQNSIKNIDTIDTVRIPNSWWTNSGSISKSLSTEDKIGLLISEADVVKKLKKDKNDYFLEELPKIETYSTSSPSFEYFILKSVKENKVDICNGIQSCLPVIIKPDRVAGNGFVYNKRIRCQFLQLNRPSVIRRTIAVADSKYGKWLQRFIIINRRQYQRRIW